MTSVIKAFAIGAAFSVSAFALSATATAQPPPYARDYYYGPDYGYYDPGYGYYPRYPRYASYCTSPRFGRWRWNPYLQRRVFVPYRWARWYLRDCYYTMGPYSYYR